MMQINNNIHIFKYDKIEITQLIKFFYLYRITL